MKTEAEIRKRLELVKEDKKGIFEKPGGDTLGISICAFQVALEWVLEEE